MREEFERQVREIESKYDKRCKDIREQNELRRRTELHWGGFERTASDRAIFCGSIARKSILTNSAPHEVVQRKNSQINALMRRHEKAFSDIKNYYNDITLNNLAHINSLKETIIGMKEKEERTEKEMAEVQTANKKLEEPLKKAKEDVEELTKKLMNYEKDKQCLASTKRRLKQSQGDMKQLAWKHEVLEQRFEKTKSERDQLYNNFVKAWRDHFLKFKKV